MIKAPLSKALQKYARQNLFYLTFVKMISNKKNKTKQATSANSSEKYVACPLEMGWEDSGRHGHIHFADKSIEGKGKCEHSSATPELKPKWRQAAPYCTRKMESHLLTSLHCGCRERRLQCFFPSQASNWPGLR